MTLTTIRIRSAKKKGDKTTPTVEFDFGQHINASRDKFGDETVHTLFVQAARQQLSDFARKSTSRKKNPLSLDDLRAALLTWKPEVKKRGTSAADKIAELAATLTPQERQALVHEITKDDPRGRPPVAMPESERPSISFALSSKTDEAGDATIAKFAPKTPG